MSFKLVKCKEPNFSQSQFMDVPDTVTASAPKDKVAPEHYHTTAIFSEYFKVKGQWLPAEESRMNRAAVYKSGRIYVRKSRNLEQGDLVFAGRTESCKDDIFIYPHSFDEEEGDHDETFVFRQRHSRETVFPKDYGNICELFRHEREHGYVVWVIGPACTFDSDSREALSKPMMNGYVGALLVGNTLVAHDLERAYLNTALGQSIYIQYSQPNGYYNHIDTINQIEFHSSISVSVGREGVDSGIIYSYVKKDVPFVLVGSIRDDGPLPEVCANVYEDQDAIRDCVREATTTVCMATTLHSTAADDMTPSLHVMPDRTVRQVYFYSVDVPEFAVDKLGDKGGLSARSIATNVQDFVVSANKGLDLWGLEYVAFQGVIMRMIWL